VGIEQGQISNHMKDPATESMLATFILVEDYNKTIWSA